MDKAVLYKKGKQVTDGDDENCLKQTEDKKSVDSTEHSLNFNIISEICSRELHPVEIIIK